MRISNLLNAPLVRRLAGLAALLVALAIAVLSLVPGPDLPDVNMSDKTEHVIAYTVLAALLSLWLGRGRLFRVLAITVVYGIGMEVAQALAGTGRTASLLDAGADLIGACLGAGFVMGLRWMAGKR